MRYASDVEITAMAERQHVITHLTSDPTTILPAHQGPEGSPTPWKLIAAVASRVVDRMSIPRSNQTVHLMRWYNVLRVRHRIESRNKFELQLYTTDDLRRQYQENGNDLIRLRDGIVTRAELIAEIRWRVFWVRFGYGIMLVMTVIAAIAAVAAALEGWE